MLELFQVTPPQPTDLMALQWVVILALTSVVVYLYRQSRKDGEKARDRDNKWRARMLEALNDNSVAIRGLADAMEALREQSSLRQDFERLRNEIVHESKK